NTVIERDNEHVVAYYARGRLQEGLGRVKEAIKDYQRIVVLTDKLPEVEQRIKYLEGSKNDAEPSFMDAWDMRVGEISGEW
ncbi:MAG: acyl carrier protein phosphodiesterase, partial [Candidatus Omnitrophota bacterium]